MGAAKSGLHLLVGAVHDHMPAIIATEQHARWFGTGPDPRDLLRPFPAALIRMIRPPH
jgi:putative SOS response-associated peptidase YedK